MMTPTSPLPPTPRARKAGRRSLPLVAATAALASLITVAPVRADITLDFETNPALPAQPNNFFAAGAMQTYSSAAVPNAYTISGGVVLGNPTFLAAFPAHGSSPNLYGTADFADPSLLDTITLTLPAADGATAVTGVFFNGQSISESYVITAMSGATVVGTLTPTLPAASSTSDFFNFAFTSTAALPITSVTFTTPNSANNGWDFFVDSIHVTTALVPEPSALVLTASGGLLIGLACRRRTRRRS